MSALDDTYGGKNAELYISVADADVWIRAHIRTRDGAGAWDRVKDVGNDQGIVLAEATQLIDAAAAWQGARYFYNQRLEFPRGYRASYYGARDEPDANFLDTLEKDEYLRQQKLDLRAATCVQAVHLLVEGPDVPRMEQAQGLSSSSRGTRYSESQGYGGTHLVLCPKAWDYLARYEGQPKVLRG